MKIRTFVTVVLALSCVCLWSDHLPGQVSSVRAAEDQAPAFERDAAWPKPLPNHWQLGYVMGIAVAPNDHVFVIHTTQDDYGQAITDKEQPNDSLKLSGWYQRRKQPGVVAAPPVLEFDPQGNLVRAWGGLGHGHPWTNPGTEKMWAEHSISVDPNGNVWIVGGGHVALKFSPEGKFLLQIGELNKTNGSNDPRYLGDPASVAFDAKANEVYIADGYMNKRIIVYDMNTGVFKRMWGRYGKKPDDSFEASKDAVVVHGTRFVHDVKVSNDGLVYGVDRHGSIQLFRTDGTFVREAKTPKVFNAVALSTDPKQTYIYGGTLDGDQQIFILRRSDFKVLGSFKSVAQHYLAVDSKGNILTTGLSMPERFLLRRTPKP